VQQQQQEEEELKYSDEVSEWMKFIQMKLSAAYQVICHIFHDIQLILKEIYLQKNSNLSTSGLNTSTSSNNSINSTSLTAPPPLPLPPLHFHTTPTPHSIEIPFESYLTELDHLSVELIPFKISYHLIPRHLIEDCLGWNEDVGYALMVMKLLKMMITSTSTTHSIKQQQQQLQYSEEAIQTLGDCLSDILTALQIGEDGQPLEFVSWKAGSAICNVISVSLSSARYPHNNNTTNSMNISSFSPISKGTSHPYQCLSVLSLNFLYLFPSLLAEITGADLTSSHFDEGQTFLISLSHSLSLILPLSLAFVADLTSLSVSLL
jgi:hypothetical protein